MREHSLFFCPISFQLFPNWKDSLTATTYELLSPAMSVLEPRLTDEGLYLIPDLVCESSFPLREAEPYFLSCSSL